jgi:cytochrome c-type biogenesis protein CcmH
VEKQMKSIIVIAVLALMLPAAVFSQQSGYDAEILKQARQIYNEIMSPYCPGKTLSNCSSGAAELLRVNIRERLAEGDAPEMIMASLVEEFGESVLASPPNEGVGRLAWATPFVALTFGLLVIVFVVRRYVRKPKSIVATSEPDPGVRARVEEELKTHQG